MEGDSDKALLRAIRGEIKELEVQLMRKREELFQAQKQIFKRCRHEWVKEQEGGEGCDGFWYGYCPYTCKHCGHFQSGPIKF